MSSPTTLRGGGSTLLPLGWTDAVYHEMAAQGRARLALVPEWQGGPKRSPEHLQKMREGLQAYHARRRAAAKREAAG